MPKKRSSILEKVSSFMNMSISLPKIRKPIIMNLIFFKKKAGKVQKFQLLRHYNYGFIQEYQFSPSSATPLVLHHEKRYFDRKERKRGHFHSIMFICMCLGARSRAQARDEVYSMGVFPAIETGAGSWNNGQELEMREVSISEDGFHGSVDERAERFIEKFYAQMRMQSQESSSTTLLLAN